MSRAFLFCVALLAILTEAQNLAQAESKNRNREQQKAPTATQQATAPAVQQTAPPATPTASPAPRPAAPAEPARPRPGAILSAVTLKDIGYAEGFRFANLGGRRELFVPMPQGADIVANELVLVVDDVSAHEARRSLEVILNDRTVAAIALDGKGSVRTIRVPLGRTRPRDGFLKFSFLYSGAATPDRCIDVRYVGDSLTVRPDTAVLSACTVHPEAGLTLREREEAAVVRAAVAGAGRVVALATADKLGTIGPYPVAELGQVDVLVTDAGDAECSVYRDAGVEVLRA